MDRAEAAAEFWPSLIMLVPLLLAAVAGAVLVVFSKQLAPWFVGEDKPLAISSALTGRDVQAIGFSIVAVLIFLRALPQIGQALWILLDALSRRFPEPVAGRRGREVWRYGIPAVIQLVLAAVLFLQARSLAGLWHRIRVGGYVRIEETDTGSVPPDQHKP
jgi:hypothetical protein